MDIRFLLSDVSVVPLDARNRVLQLCASWPRKRAMFELLPETRDNLIAVKMFGVVSAADYEQFMPNIEDLIARAAPALAFVDWEDFDGWAADAEWYSFWYRVTNRRAFERVAIVARETWQDEVAHLARLLDRAEVRRFEPAEHAAAWAWIMGS